MVSKILASKTRCNNFCEVPFYKIQVLRTLWKTSLSTVDDLDKMESLHLIERMIFTAGRWATVWLFLFVCPRVLISRFQSKLFCWLWSTFVGFWVEIDIRSSKTENLNNFFHFSFGAFSEKLFILYHCAQPVAHSACSTVRGLRIFIGHTTAISMNK